MKKHFIVIEDKDFFDLRNWTKVRTQCTDEWELVLKIGTFRIVSSLGFINQFDKNLLHFLSYEFYKTEPKDYTYVTTRHDIAKNLFYDLKSPGKYHYKRIMDSLFKWKQVTLKYTGLAAGNGCQCFRSWSIIDEVFLNIDTGELKVIFRKSHIDYFRTTRFYKLLEYGKYRYIHDDVSVKLFEFFIEQKLNHMTIDLHKLAQELMIDLTNPNLIIRSIEKAIKELNKKTEYIIKFNYDKQSKLCTMQKYIK